MKEIRYIFAAAVLFILPLFRSAYGGPFSFFSIFSSGANWDFNGDGTIRVAFLSVPQLSGGIRSADICADLERMIKASTRKPARVSLEAVSSSKSLMGWYYHPDSSDAKARLFSGEFDLLLLAESDTVSLSYPEFFFEGVLAVSRRAREKNTRTALVLTCKPGNSFRDKRVTSAADRTYRVGDGCGIDVIPAAYGWIQTLAHNRMRGDSSVKARAGAFLSAAAVWNAFTGEDVPSGGLDADWTTQATTRVLAQSARDAVQIEREKSHYAGPFEGIVRIVPRLRKRLKIFLPNTAEDDPLRLNFASILDSAHLDSFWRTPADWYREGFDRYSTCFDLVFGDIPQIDQYLNPALYTSFSVPPTNMPSPAVAVFNRIPDAAGENRVTLENLEGILMMGYDYAKSNGAVFIPYPLAWARAREKAESLVVPSCEGKMNDWLNYMLANMVYTAISDRYQPSTEKTKPHGVNSIHPQGVHETCARIGYDIMVQLSSLRAARNTILLRSETYRVGKGNPGFASIRLLDKPRSDVTVYCATDKPGQARLSREEILFTPENYNIEQTVRIDPATNTPALFTCFMASARSSDANIDGRNDLRPLVLNYDEGRRGVLSFDRDEVSPGSGFTVRLRARERPTDMVRVRIRQDGLLEQERYLVPEYGDGVVLRLHPTEEDYQNGKIRVTVLVDSPDLRFNGGSFTQTFRLSANGKSLPTVRLTQPAQGKPIQGPAFVTARAESDTTSGVSRLSVFLGQKGLASTQGPVCLAPVENGPPQSRLPAGAYMLWAEAESTNGAVLATPPMTLHVE